jgi:DNA repair exonuclease SbcCD ATPase subunit
MENNAGNNEAFMEMAVEKLERQDEKLSAIQKQLENISGGIEKMGDIKKDLAAIAEGIKEVRYPEEDMRQLSENLTAGILLIKYPPPQKVLHEHHVPKLLWIAAGLLLALCITCSGWFRAARKLNGFIANDTKYRWLRLDTTRRNFQIFLQEADSLYRTQRDLRETVIETENRYLENIGRLEKAGRLKEEAKELEKKAREKFR